MKARTPWLTLALLLLLSGCSSSKVVAVTGKVTYNGQPIPHVLVSFRPEDGRPSWGQTNDAGEFSLHYDADHEGAEIGRHLVTLKYKPSSPDEELGKAGAKLSKEMVESLARYGDGKSDLHVEIVKNGPPVEIKLP